MEHEVVLESGWPSVVLHFVAVKFKSGNGWWCELTGRLIECVIWMPRMWAGSWSCKL